jgi:SAM-dependent methyltransferase
LNRAPTQAQWQPLVRRYETGEWRARVFRDFILAEVSSYADPVMLDIGSGNGFDDDPTLQASLAARAREYIGVEPDQKISVREHLTSVHACLFEQAPIPSGSIDIAFSVMVLEHLQCPADFFSKLRDVLRPGGVFWGFTMDARHWFVTASMLASRLRLKDWYLDKLHGRPGQQRYTNYEVFYKANTPRQITKLTPHFSQCDMINLFNPGQLDFYVPSPLRPLVRSVNQMNHLLGRPGSVLAVRLLR